MADDDFTERAEIRNIIRQLKEDATSQPLVVSDIVDDQGRQYVDLVLQGGGVLGIALAGYTYVLEEMDIRFRRIAGTSAGAINALLLAALGSPSEKKTVKLLPHLIKLQLSGFLDGAPESVDFIRTLLAKPKKFKLLMKGFLAFDHIEEDLGLNPGLALQEWVTAILDGEGISTTRALYDRLNTDADRLRHRRGITLTEAQRSFTVAIIAADISTETKVQFPKMAPLYWDQPDEVHPAVYVRASMSIPFVFQPFVARDIPQGQNAWDLWDKLAGYQEDLPQDCVFMDGGIMSNFPIDIFHSPFSTPASPTFGAKLGSSERKAHSIGSPAQLATAVFDSARHSLDYDFISRNPDYKHVVHCIDTEPHHWLNFDLPDEDKYDLFRRGARGAEAFLRKFKWDTYKDIRIGISEAFVRDAEAAQIHLSRGA